MAQCEFLVINRDFGISSPNFVCACVAGAPRFRAREPLLLSGRRLPCLRREEQCILCYMENPPLHSDSDWTSVVPFLKLTCLPMFLTIKSFRACRDECQEKIALDGQRLGSSARIILTRIHFCSAQSQAEFGRVSILHQDYL